MSPVRVHSFHFALLRSATQAVQLESVSQVRVRYLIVVSTLGNKQESILLGMDFPGSDRCVLSLDKISL